MSYLRITGIITDENKHEFMKLCSKHKSRWTPPSTPDSFWEIGIHTPEEWKAQRQELNQRQVPQDK
jgi:hypothetical protein